MTAVSHGINGRFGKLSNNSCKFITFLETSSGVVEWFSEKKIYVYIYIILYLSIKYKKIYIEKLVLEQGKQVLEFP